MLSCWDVAVPYYVIVVVTFFFNDVALIPLLLSFRFGSAAGTPLSAMGLGRRALLGVL